MSSSDFSAQAQAGNPAIIASYLSRRLRPQSIDVKVGCHRGALHIALTSDRDLDPESWSAVVSEALRRLRVTTETLYIHGFSPQQSSPRWTRLRTIAAAATPLTTATRLTSPRRIAVTVLAIALSLGCAYGLGRTLLGLSPRLGPAIPPTSSPR